MLQHLMMIIPLVSHLFKLLIYLIGNWVTKLNNMFTYHHYWEKLHLRQQALFAWEKTLELCQSCGQNVHFFPKRFWFSYSRAMCLWLETNPFPNLNKIVSIYPDVWCFSNAFHDFLWPFSNSLTFPDSPYRSRKCEPCLNN